MHCGIFTDFLRFLSPRCAPAVVGLSSMDIRKKDEYGDTGTGHTDRIDSAREIVEEFEGGKGSEATSRTEYAGQNITSRGAEKDRKRLKQAIRPRRETPKHTGSDEADSP